MPTIETSKEVDANKLVEEQGMTKEQAANAEEISPGLATIKEAIMNGGKVKVFSGTVQDDGTITLTVNE